MDDTEPDVTSEREAPGESAAPSSEYPTPGSSGGDTEAGDKKALPGEIREDIEANRAKIPDADEILQYIDQAERESEPRRARDLAMAWRLVEARKESFDNRDRWVRAAADLENFKKRTLQERSKLLKYRNEEVLRDLLPVLDNLERALEHSDESGDTAAFVEGVKMIAGMLKEVLERYGVTGLESLDHPFDPNVHEAISKAPDPHKDPNTVIHQLEKGYMYQDRLLRPAKVVVSYEPES